MKTWRWIAPLVLAGMTILPAEGSAQTGIAKELAPTGTLRVAVLMLSYFANEDAGQLKGWSPELGLELARRLGVPYELVRIHNPADMIAAFKEGRIDTQVGPGGDQSQPGNMRWIPDGQIQRNCAAHGVADKHGLIQPERSQEFDHLG